MQKALENCEQSLNTSLQMIHLAFLVLLLKNREQVLVQRGVHFGEPVGGLQKFSWL